MNKLQKKLYQLLLEIDEVCNDNDISYYLSAGCALGAIRQGKFIDWDDDVDVFLTRDNWEKLKVVLEEECPDNRKLIHKDNTPYYRNTVARYVDLDTLSLRESMMLCPEVMSVAVELFILDPFPADEEAQGEHIQSLKLYSELLDPYTVLNSGNTKSEIGFDFELYKEYKSHIEEQGESNVLNALEEKFTCTSESDCDTYCLRWGRIPFLFSKELIGSGRKELFEGHEFPTMQFSERSFRTGYGDDWMYLSRSPDQSAHNKYIDLDYIQSRRYSLSGEEKEVLFSEFVRKKDINIEKIQTRRARDRMFSQLQATVVARKMKEANREVILREALRNGEYSTINEFFSDYYELINNARFKGYDVRIELSEELFFVAMLNLIMQGKYYNIPAYLADEFSGISNEEYRQELCAKYDFCRNLSIAIYDKHSTEETSNILASSGEFADLLDYHRGRLWVLTERAEKKEDYDEVIKQADHSMVYFGEDGEILCYKAEALYHCSDMEKAEELFESGVRKTRNGLLLRRAEELCDVKAPAHIFEGDIHFSPAGRLLIVFHKFCEELKVRYYLTARKKENNNSLASDNYIEVAMSHDDIIRFKEAMESSNEFRGTDYSLEYVHGVIDEIESRFRFCNKKTCLVDIREFDEQANHYAYISIHEIEKYGSQRIREQYRIMRSGLMGKDVGKHEIMRRKSLIAAKCSTFVGAAMPEKMKESILRSYRQRHFVISNGDLFSKQCKLRIGNNTADSNVLVSAGFIPLGEVRVPVLWDCKKKAQDAPVYVKRDLRFQIIDSDRAYEDVIIDTDLPYIGRCCGYQKEMNRLSNKSDAETKTIKSYWKIIQKQITDYSR